MKTPGILDIASIVIGIPRIPGIPGIFAAGGMMMEMRAAIENDQGCRLHCTGTLVGCGFT